MRAAEGKASHLAEVRFATPVQIPVFSNSFADAASRYSVLTGRVSATQILVDRRHITTWYRLNVDQVLIHHDSPFISFSLDNIPPLERPTNLLPLANKQILLTMLGGTTVMDGVSLIERRNGDKALELNHSYLFILDTSPDQLARLPFDLNGVFAIAKDGDLSLMTSLSDPVSDDVKSTYIHSLTRIKQKLAKLSNR